MRTMWTEPAAAVTPGRLKLWQALSTLFLDTEVGDDDFAYIARVIQETGYSVTDAQSILWGEVYPALVPNLLCVAGEWAGWSDEWLLAHLRVRGRKARRPWGFLAREMEKQWREVLRRLPPGYT